MPTTKQDNLTNLLRQGEAMMPNSGMSAVRYQRTPSGHVWGGTGRPRLGAADTENGNGQKAAARRKLVRWLERAYGPDVVDILAISAGAEPGEMPDQLSGLGNNGEDEQGWFDKIVSGAKEILPAYLQAKQQEEILDMQLERAKAGLDPLETGEFAPSVQVGLDEQTVQRMADEAINRARTGVGEFAKPFPWLIAIGIGFVFLATQDSKRNRGGRRKRRR